MKINLHSKKIQLGWAIWILFLGISLLFFHTLTHINSFSQYLNAFLILDMPSSWCPTFLILYGLFSTASYFFKPLTLLSRITGLVLLPIGTYTLITYTFSGFFDTLFIYFYAQTIHVSELLTGLWTVFLLIKKNED
jgi:hypothetical protein